MVVKKLKTATIVQFLFRRGFQIGFKNAYIHFPVAPPCTRPGPRHPMDPSLLFIHLIFEQFHPCVRTLSIYRLQGVRVPISACVRLCGRRRTPAQGAAPRSSSPSLTWTAGTTRRCLPESSELWGGNSAVSHLRCYCIDRCIYLNLSKSTQSVAGWKALKPAANNNNNNNNNNIVHL